jgi:hypothetical protein
MPAPVRAATLRAARPVIWTPWPTVSTAIDAAELRCGLARFAALLAIEEKARLATP